MPSGCTPPRPRRPRHHRRRGFTLLEIIVVVTIIALLATLVAPRLLSQVGKAKANAARAKASTVTSAIKLYLLDVGLSAPADNFDLQVLMLRPDDGGGPSGPYLERAGDLLDPWDNPFIIVVPGEGEAVAYRRIADLQDVLGQGRRVGCRELGIVRGVKHAASGRTGDLENEGVHDDAGVLHHRAGADEDRVDGSE